jgi:hypothetical protein
MSILFQSSQNAIPSAISYPNETKSDGQKNSWYWDLCYAPVQKTGELLRKVFYLPRYNNNVDRALQMDQDLAARVSQVIMGNAISSSDELRLIQRCFSVRDIPVRLEGGEGGISRIFTIRLFASKSLIQNKRLQLFLFSFNGNQEEEMGKKRKWEPLTISELSQAPLQVLRALKQEGVSVDSLMTASLGNVVLDALKDLPSSASHREIIPPTIVINRGLTSVKKVAHRLYSFPLNYLLHAAAKLSGWDANPEEGLLNFLGSNPQETRASKRNVFIIETTLDTYFSGNGSFAPDFHKKIEQVGAGVFRGRYYPFPFHVRSHHAMPLDRLVHNNATEVAVNTHSFVLEDGQKVSSLIANSIFLEGEEEVHTCFYVAGSDATLDTGAVRDVIPLLSACINEGAARSELEDEGQNVV